MKLAASLALLPATFLADPVLQHGPYRQNAIYMEKNFNWGNMYNDLKTALDSGYNRFYVGFYMANYGCQAGCAEWARLEESQRQNVTNSLDLNYIHSNEISIFRSRNNLHSIFSKW